MPISSQELQAALVKYAKQECKKYGIKFCHHKGQTIRGQEKSILGFFDPDPKVLELHFVSGRKGFSWEHTLAHELAHIHQWWEQANVWKAYSLNQNIPNTIRLEFDCEIRAIKILENLGFKHCKDYTKQANYHVLTYFHYRDRKEWPSPDPSQSGRWKKMPATFDIDLFATYQELKYLFDSIP